MESIFQLRQQLEDIWVCIETISIENTPHKKFIGAMFYVALNHCDAIQILLQKRNFASADALARPMLETTIRSIWLNRVASEKQIQQCMDRDKFQSSWEMTEALENDANMPPMLSKFWSYLKPVMHSYTHGGVENALRQIHEDGSISPSKPESEIESYIQIVGAMSITVLSEMSSLTANNNMGSKLKELEGNYLEWAFNKQRNADSGAGAPPPVR